MPIRKLKRIVSDTQKHESAESVEDKDQLSKSGHMPSVDSDDNVLEEAQEDEDLYLEADEEHPQELGLGEQVNKAERKHQRDD